MKKHPMLRRIGALFLCFALVPGAAFLVGGNSDFSALSFSVSAASTETTAVETSGSSAGTSSTAKSGATNSDRQQSGSDSKSSGSSASNASVTSSDNISTVVGTYADDSVKVTITKVSGENLTYFVADITVASVDDLKTAFAFGQYGSSYRQYTSAMASSNNAILAINGDYYNYRTDGIIIRNGVLYRNSPSNRQMLIIDKNGDFSFAKESDVNADTLVGQSALDTFSFGPALVADGEVQDIPSSYFIKTTSNEPRCAIGQIGKLHYLFVVADGRSQGYSMGVTVAELAQIMKNLGCADAYNLDGGGSATLVFKNEVINKPSNGGDGGERSISDIIYIA